MVARLQDALGSDYRIERELGGGGMSRVFLATEVGLKRSVVIKLLPPELTSDVMAARFRRELEVTAGLQHPHILPVLANGARGGLLYYITPFVEGETLRLRLSREGKLSVDDTVAILAELASALGYAHDRGVVHRDIKPENVLLSDGHAVLSDFGIAAVAASEGKSEAGGARLTEVGFSLGTPGYMSPEQATGENVLDGRSDLYSLAIVGFEMLTGSPPFVGASPMSVITQHLTKAPPNARELRSDVPAPLAAAIEKALAKKPSDRFQSAAAFRDALGARYSEVTGARARQRLRYVVAGVAALAAVVAAFVVTRGGNRTAKTGMDQNLIAVAPFDVFDPNYQVWREGLVDVLAANLDGAGPLRSVSPAVAVKRWKGDAAERTSAMEFARGLNAGVVIFGRVLASGRDTVRIEAAVVDATTERVIGEVQVRDDISRMDRIADSLSFRILAELGESRAIGLVRRGTIGSTSVPAIKAYLQGAQYYRRSAWDSATVYFQRAVASDSNFAPALRLLANAISWQTSVPGQQRPDLLPYALRAGANNHGLAPRESLLVASDSIFVALSRPLRIDLIARRQGSGLPTVDMYVQAKRLFDLLERATNRFPEDPEIWFKLGDARFHMGYLLPSTQTLVETRAAFDRAIALDSAFTPSYIHLVQVLNQLQDVQAMRAAMAKFLALEPGGEQAGGLRFATKLLDPATARDPKSLGELFRAADQRAISTAYQTLLYLNDSAETQVAVARAMRTGIEAGGVPQAFVEQARGSAAQAFVARGHLRDALAIAPNSTSLVVQAGLVGILPKDSVDRVVTRASAQPNGQSVWVMLTWLAIQRDVAGVRHLLDRLGKSKSEFTPATIPAAFIALARGDTAAAIHDFTLPDSVCLTWCPVARLHLARLLAARGEDAKAAPLYDQDFASVDVGKIMWMLDRGRVNQRLGNRAKAIDSYAYVTSAWQNPDPELKPIVDEARRGLSALRSDPPRQ
jgi:tetratricopeptide (TPR) repeat protein